jgi:hypothetical protein
MGAEGGVMWMASGVFGNASRWPARNSLRTLTSVRPSCKCSSTGACGIVAFASPAPSLPRPSTTVLWSLDAGSCTACQLLLALLLLISAPGLATLMLVVVDTSMSGRRHVGHTATPDGLRAVADGLLGSCHRRAWEAIRCWQMHRPAHIERRCQRRAGPLTH